MLLELRVENLLLLERAELRLARGLNVITGETGAGKTVLAHALDLLLGGKPRPGIVRPGASEAYVEGVFRGARKILEDEDELGELRERLPEGEDELVLGRRVGAEGRTRAFVGGRSATAPDLRALGGRLLSFYGQHEHRKLMLSSAQLEILDSFCGAGQLRRRSEMASAHGRVSALRRELEELRVSVGARERERDLLRFELAEIDELHPEEAEERDLGVERERLRRLDALREAAGAGIEAIAPDSGEGGVPERLAAAEAACAPAAGGDPALDALAGRLGSLRLELEDLGSELRAYGEGLEAEPGRLRIVEERLAAYDRLKRKHGGTVESVLEHARRCRQELDRLEQSEEALERAEAALGEATAQQDALAGELGAERRRAAPELARRVLDELSELAMEAASFRAELPPRERVGATGAEGVELSIAPNPGVPAAPLRETASGGELSRIMLALMTVASAGGPETLVFDEVDAGIGGQTARAVGEKLRRVAGDRQVLCITHLPQIASLAERHFRIEKGIAGDLSTAGVEALEGQAVVEELCRMLGADKSDRGARRHAEELLAAA
jgi:DNA repair protein RecN (Recombination protein N)